MVRTSTRTLLFMGALALPAQAWAQGQADIATRRDLVEQAVRMQSAGNHASALDLAQRAGRIQMTPSLRMLIAQEQSATGQIAGALSSAELCEREATSTPGVRDREGIISVCHDLAVSLRPRVGRITVRPPARAPNGLRITVNGDVLNEALYGVPYVVTPGPVHVEARAPGFQDFSRDVTVTTGGVGELSVELQAVPQSVLAPPRPIVGPWIVMGVGVASLGVSLATFVLRNSAIASVDSMCNGPQGLNCDPAARAPYNSAVTLNATSITTFAVGTAALVGGVAWLIAANAGRPARRETAPGVPQIMGSVTPLRDGALFNLVGSF